MHIFHRLTRSIFRVLVLLMICGGGIVRAGETLVRTAKPAAQQPPAQQPPPRRLRSWLNALSFAESGNRPWIVHQDRDGRFYYGCLQFRAETFQYYVKKFDFAPDAQDVEVMDLIYDCAFQKRLAARMIGDDPENWKHWRNTVGRIGLPPGAAKVTEARAPDPAAPGSKQRIP